MAKVKKDEEPVFIWKPVHPTETIRAGEPIEVKKIGVVHLSREEWNTLVPEQRAYNDFTYKFVDEHVIGRHYPTWDSFLDALQDGFIPSPWSKAITEYLRPDFIQERARNRAWELLAESNNRLAAILERLEARG